MSTFTNKVRVTRNWTTSDGAVFTSERIANAHEGRIAVHRWCEDRGIGRGGEWSGDMVARAIVADAQRLLACLEQLLGEGSFSNEGGK